jgi:hypothetical protein
MTESKLIFYIIILFCIIRKIPLNYTYDHLQLKHVHTRVYDLVTAGCPLASSYKDVEFLTVILLLMPESCVFFRTAHSARNAARGRIGGGGEKCRGVKNKLLNWKNSTKTT